MSEEPEPDPRPPRAADALLRLCLPPGVAGLSILGDLHQDFQERVYRGSLLGHRLRYWRTALALACWYALRRSPIPLPNPGSPVPPRPMASPGGGAAAGDWATTIADGLADFRFAMRMLARTPLLSLTAVLTIGLGVGLTTQTFSAVYGSTMRGLPVPGAERLMFVDENRLELDIRSTEMSIHDFLDLRREQTSFEDVAAFYQGTVSLAGEEGLPERFAGAYLTANALSHLGVPPLLGRTFLPGEDGPGAAPAVVLSHHVWRNRFGGDPAILGRAIRVNGRATEVVGVMPEGFRFPFQEDLWLPHRLDPAALPRGAGEDLDVFGRLRAGVSVEAARSELAAVAAGLAQRFPETNRGVGMGVERYDYRFMPRHIQAILWMMLGSTLGVLLIACANVANLLLARAATRTREVAIRTALGSSRGRVVRQLLLESALLAALGGALGLAMGVGGLRLYEGIAAGIRRPYWIDPRMEIPVLLFALGVTAAAALLAGILPALRASGVRAGEVLKDESRGSSGLRLGRFSHALVVAEIAVSCSLLVGAGFMVKSVRNAGRVELGFESASVLTGRLTLHEADYPDAGSRERFLALLRERLREEPWVEEAALGTHLPGLGSFRYFLAVEGEAYATDRDYPSVNAAAVSAGYFRTFGVEPLQGREFDALEARAGGDPVVVVNRSFAERYLEGGPALGRRLRLGLGGSTEPWLTVVGVVPDMHVGGGVGGLGDDRIPPERIFLPLGLHDLRAAALAVRTRGEPEAMAARLRAVVAELDPNLPVYDVAALDRSLEQATWAFRLFGVQFSVFGGMALFLAAVGLYGVMAFAVTQRRREMGVRMALGAEGRSIALLVLGRGAVQLSLGTAVGVGMGAAMARPMRAILFGVETADPALYLTIVATLLTTGFVACLLPALAATRVDPVEAMRSP